MLQQDSIEGEGREKPKKPSNRPEYHEEGYTKDGAKYHRCMYPDCGKVFRFKSEISRHLVVHFPKRPHKCEYEGCDKTFKRQDALEEHYRVHTKAIVFPCTFPDCRQEFSTRGGLKYHLLKHTNERPFKCTLPNCTKSFLTALQLKQHEKAVVYHFKISRNQESVASKEKGINNSFHKDESSEFSSNNRELPDEELADPHIEKDLRNLLNEENHNADQKIKLYHELISLSPIHDRSEINFENINAQKDPTAKGPSLNSFFDQMDFSFLETLKEKNQYDL